MFKKSMLQEGDIVECAGGYFYRYTKCFPSLHAQQFRLLGNEGWLDLESFDDNLTLHSNPYVAQEVRELFTVVNIYRHVSGHCLPHPSLHSTRLDSSFTDLQLLINSPNYLPFKK